MKPQADDPRTSPILASLVYIEGNNRTTAILIKSAESPNKFFLIDTGSTYNILDSNEFANLRVLSDKLPVDTAAGQMIKELFSPPQIVVGPFDIAEGGPVACVDLRPISDILKHKVSGVIGISCLRRFVLQIDRPNRVFRILSGEATRQPDWGSEIPMLPDSEGLPQVRLQMDGVETLFTLDTGSTDFVTLTSDCFKNIVARTNCFHILL